MVARGTMCVKQRRLFYKLLVLRTDAKLNPRTLGCSQIKEHAKVEIPFWLAQTLALKFVPCDWRDLPD